MLNLFIAFLAGVLTWMWIGKLAWKYAMKAERGTGPETVRQNMMRKLPPDDFEALRSAVEDEARRRAAGY